jgi:RNA polymerase sigma-70 factor (ECF subfamily)
MLSRAAKRSSVTASDEFDREDLALVSAVLMGDGAAFAALHARHRRAVTVRLAYLLGPRPGVEDLVQETFLRAYRALSSFRGECPFRWWILRIATFAARSEQRSLRRSIWRLFRGEEEEQQRPLSVPAPAEQYPELMWVHAALQRLSPPLREAVILFELEGLTLIEIAGQLDVPLHTVAARVRRGREALREKLEALRDERSPQPRWVPCRGDLP